MGISFRGRDERRRGSKETQGEKGSSKTTDGLGESTRGVGGTPYTPSISGGVPDGFSGSFLVQGLF